MQEADRAERHRDQLSRGLVVELVGYGDEGAGLGDDLLGPGPEAATRGHPLAHGEVLDPVTEGIDDTDGLGAGARGQLGLEPVGAADGPEVVVVDRCQGHPDPDLAGAGLGKGLVEDGQGRRRLAEGLVHDSTHGALLS